MTSKNGRQPKKKLMEEDLEKKGKKWKTTSEKNEWKTTSNKNGRTNQPKST